MMDETRQIVELLERVPVPPSRVTAQEALRLGRRGVRRRRRFTVAAAAVATVLVAVASVNLASGRRAAPLPIATDTPSPPDARWTISTLPGLGTAKLVAAQDVDSTGRYIVGLADGLPVLWDNEKPVLLPAPEPKLRTVRIDGVNSRGVVVGTAWRRDGSSFAWVFRDWASATLPALGNDRHYQARDVNDRGDILGWSEESGALLWPSAEPGRVRSLGSNVDAVCLGEDGSVGGASGDGRHPYVWDAAGKGSPLAEATHPGGRVEFLSGEWAAGWVTGQSSSEMVAARWNLRTGELRTYTRFHRVQALSGDGGLVLTAVGLDRPVFMSPNDGLMKVPALSDDPQYPFGVGAMTFDGKMLVGSARSPAGTFAVVWRFG